MTKGTGSDDVGTEARLFQIGSPGSVTTPKRGQGCYGPVPSSWPLLGCLLWILFSSPFPSPLHPLAPPLLLPPSRSPSSSWPLGPSSINPSGLQPALLVWSSLLQSHTRFPWAPHPSLWSPPTWGKMSNVFWASGLWGWALRKGECFPLTLSQVYWGESSNRLDLPDKRTAEALPCSAHMLMDRKESPACSCLCRLEDLSDCS